MKNFSISITLFVFGFSFFNSYAEERSKEGIVFFEKSVRPLLAKHCYKCHSSTKGQDKGGLVLDSQDGWMDGGDSGPAIVPGSLSDSILIEAIEQKDPD